MAQGGSLGPIILRHSYAMSRRKQWQNTRSLLSKRGEIGRVEARSEAHLAGQMSPQLAQTDKLAESGGGPLICLAASRPDR